MIVDVVIPVYNEAQNIEPLFDELESVSRGMIRSIVVADNGSTDGSGDRVRQRRAVVVDEPRRGYGSACLKALEWIAKNASGPPDIVVFLDADLSDDPRDLHDLLEPIHAGRAAIVIGSRIRRAEPGSLNLVQRFGNRLACLLIRVLGGRRFSDIGPLRAATWDALGELRMADQTWGWTVEMQMKAAILDIPTAEVDVAYRKRRFGRSKISGTVRGVAAAGTRIILTAFVLWWQRKKIRRAAAQLSR